MADADWLPELADDDLEVLIEALEAWELKDLSGEIMGDLFEGMLSGSDPAGRAAAQERRSREQVKRNADKRLRKERSVLLRAKLLMIRDRRRAKSMADTALGRTN